MFQRRIKRISAKKLIYVDECGIDKYLYREYGRALRGQPVMGKISGKKFNRTNIVAGICQGKWVAPRQYDGSADSNLFEFWFENCLLAEIRGKYIAMDNATFHRKTRLTELAATKKCKILWLPAYSPDLNPIEKKWAWLKQKLRKQLLSSNSFDLALWYAFQLD